MGKTITLVLGLAIVFSIISCSNKSIPIGLRKTIKQIDNSLNDTIKYDFIIAPERIANMKHHFGLGIEIKNGRNLWKGGLLKMYFKLHGIKHPDDMSAIILTTYHRKLREKPINFKKQKQYYKEYWKVANLGRDTLYKWRQLKNPIENLELNQKIYFSNFYEGRKVLGSIHAWKKWENGMSGSEVNYIAEVIERKERELKLKILEIGNPKKGYKLSVMVGDTIKNEPYGVFLIPENK